MRYLSFFTGISVIILFTGCGNNSTGETIYVPQNNDSNAVVSSQADTSVIPLNNPSVITNIAPDISTPILTNQQPGQPIQPVTIAAGMNPEHGKPGHNCDIAVGAPLNSSVKPQQPTTAITPTINTSEISAKNATIVTTSQPATGMNPEHGKPGHRCDIAVGAPLNSKPAEVKSTQPTIVTSDVPATVKSDASNNTPVTPLLPSGVENPIKEGMNPEHGKPGHKCEIAVGAPLPKQ